MGKVSIVPIQLVREDMALTCKVLVVLILAITMAETFSLPPVKFLKDFAIKYQRSSIVMNLPKEISRHQLLKRYTQSPHKAVSVTRFPLALKSEQVSFFELSPPLARKKSNTKGQLQEWTEHSTLIFENLKPVEISKHLVNII